MNHQYSGFTVRFDQDLDQEMQTAIDLDTNREERKTQCSYSQKPKTQNALKEQSTESKEHLPLSSKTSQAPVPFAGGYLRTSKQPQPKNSGKLLKPPSSGETSQTEKLLTDPCGRCGCSRAGHQPGKTYSYAKSGGSSGKSHEIPILARTCCVCKFCFCFCTAFVEPFKGQKFLKCVYDPT
jgi:hypothetical protein